MKAPTLDPEVARALAAALSELMGCDPATVVEFRLERVAGVDGAILRVDLAKRLEEEEIVKLEAAVLSA